MCQRWENSGICIDFLLGMYFHSISVNKGRRTGMSLDADAQADAAQTAAAAVVHAANAGEAEQG